jgi:hypothetical protein
MATTTPNYGWDVPTSTDYVKDGATAIETLGDDIDATLWTALGGTYPGLRLIKKQTIGSAVSTVAVTSAFSATYEAYKIVVTGGVASTGSMIQLQLGSTTTGYYNAGFYATYAGGSVLNTPTSNGSNWSHCGYGNTNSIYMGIELFNPFLAKNTQMTSSAAQSATGGIGLFNSGYLNDTTSYTGFSLIPAVGTLTGGTIYVYGYGIS